MFRAKSFYSLAKSLKVFWGAIVRTGKSIESSTATVELMRVVKTLLSIEFSRGKDFLLDESSRLGHFGKFSRQLGKN